MKSAGVIRPSSGALKGRNLFCNDHNDGHPHLLQAPEPLSTGCYPFCRPANGRGNAGSGRERPLGISGPNPVAGVKPPGVTRGHFLSRSVFVPHKASVRFFRPYLEVVSEGDFLTWLSLHFVAESSKG
jgi:hypothetical protein